MVSHISKVFHCLIPKRRVDGKYIGWICRRMTFSLISVYTSMYTVNVLRVQNQRPCDSTRGTNYYYVLNSLLILDSCKLYLLIKDI